MNDMAQQSVAYNTIDDRVGYYMHTSSGRPYWPFDPREDEVDINVIAHHLANQCRYNGATQHPTDPTRIFYSVAEHSVYVFDYVVKILGRPDLAIVAFLHDGSEAYNGDLIRPLKYSSEFKEPFKKVEEINEKIIARRFNMQWPMPAEVKIADEAVTAAEVSQIIVRDPAFEWTTGSLHDRSHVADIEIMMLPPYEAKLQFLEAWKICKELRS